MKITVHAILYNAHVKVRPRLGVKQQVYRKIQKKLSIAIIFLKNQTKTVEAF